jgi:hypothetical protein
MSSEAFPGVRLGPCQPFQALCTARRQAFLHPKPRRTWRTPPVAPRQMQALDRLRRPQRSLGWRRRRPQPASWIRSATAGTMRATLCGTAVRDRANHDPAPWLLLRADWPRLLPGGCAAVDHKHRALTIARFVGGKVEAAIGHLLRRPRAFHRRQPVGHIRIIEKA